MVRIEGVTALEILDSRGQPTVQATCLLADGASGTASVPAGASRGAAEARERRDKELRRYGGRGCRRAVEHIKTDIHHALQGREIGTQQDLDRALIDLDGTPDKSRLGANALLAVSLAFARATAEARDLPLYRYFAEMVGGPVTALPRPMINLFSGGAHAGGQVPIQDVLVMPRSAETIDDLLAMTYAIYQSAASLVQHKYGMRLLTADEGGLAPPFGAAVDMLEDAMKAIAEAGYEPGNDFVLAIDVAASQFYSDGCYRLGSESLDAPGMIDRLAAWGDQYPIVAVEDGLAEDDWAHWPALLTRLSGHCLVIGDDLLCTSPERIQRAVDERAADALLLKVNQIGTLTEAAESYLLARSAGWSVIVSARSGETEDDWLADLAVGWSADHIKVGSITQSERLAKYNRLLAIEAREQLPVVGRPHIGTSVDDPTIVRSRRSRPLPDR